MPKCCVYIVKFLFVISAFCSTMASAVGNEKSVDNIITDLDYGVALFHYYQGNHQEALIEFSIIEAKRKIIHKGVSPELVKGDINLSYGLYDEANEIFDRLLNEDVIELAQAQADTWYSRGKLHYHEGNKLAASEAFSRVGKELSPRFRDEFYYFKAQLALQNQDTKSYLQFKGLISKNNPFHSYLSHHYLLHKINIGQLTRDDINTPFLLDDPESVALAERSYLAMGYAFINTENPVAATDAFKKISLDSFVIEPALLGYGWALNNLERYEEANKLFGQLTFHHDVNYYVQESILASAHASELLGDYQSALTMLNRGVDKFTQQKKILDNAQQLLSKGNSCYQLIVLKISNHLSCDEQHFGFKDSSLLNILTSTEFSTKREQLHQVNYLKKQFKHKLIKLHAYQEMLLEKQKTTQSKLNNIEFNTIRNDIDTLTQRRNDLASQIKLAKDNDESYVFLPDDLLEKHYKIASTFDKLDQLKVKNKSIIKAQIQHEVDRYQTYQNILTKKKLVADAKLNNIEVTTLKNKVATLAAQRDSVALQVRLAQANIDNSDELLDMQKQIISATDKLKNLKDKTNNTTKQQMDIELRKLDIYQKMFVKKQRIAQAKLKNIDTLAATKKLTKDDPKSHDVIIEEARTRLKLIEGYFNWQTDYNYVVNLNETQQRLSLLDSRIVDLKAVYQKLLDHEVELVNITQELTDIESIRNNVMLQMTKSNDITNTIELAFKQPIKNHFKQRQDELTQSIIIAKLAIVRIQDVIFKYNEEIVSINTIE